VIERVWALQRQTHPPSLARDTIERQGAAPDLKEKVKVLSEAQRSVLGDWGADRFSGTRRLAKHENVEACRARAQIGGRMERGLKSVALIAELGPLLGLLGTVHVCCGCSGTWRRTAGRIDDDLARHISRRCTRRLPGCRCRAGLDCVHVPGRRIDNLSLNLNDTSTSFPRIYR